MKRNEHRPQLQSALARFLLCPLHRHSHRRCLSRAAVTRNEKRTSRRLAVRVTLYLPQKCAERVRLSKEWRFLFVPTRLRKWLCFFVKPDHGLTLRGWIVRLPRCFVGPTPRPVCRRIGGTHCRFGRA